MTTYVFDGKLPAFFHMETVLGLLPVSASRPVFPPSASKTSVAEWRISRCMHNPLIQIS